jgi:hypothetical protein
MLVCAAILLFSDIGYGKEVWEELSEHKDLSENCMRGAMALSLFLYIFDFSYWTGFLGYLKGLIVSVIVLSVCGGCALVASDYPYAPMAVYVGIQAPWLMLLKRFLFPYTPMTNYLQSISYGLILSGLLSLGVWVTWVLTEDKWWQGATRIDLREKMGCLEAQVVTEALDDAAVSGVEPPQCLAAYLLWFSPCMMGIAFFLFGCVAGLLASSLKKHSSRFVKMKVFMSIVGVLIMGMYIAASVAGAGSGIAGSVWAFSAACLILVCGLFYVGIGFQRMKALFTPMVSNLMTSEAWWLDWAKAIFLWCFGPMLVLYALLSMANQIVRNSLMGCTSWSRAFAKQPAQRYPCFTLTTSTQLARLANWRWTSVLVKIIWVGLGFIIFNVGVAKVVTVFMSWLNGKLALLSIPACVGIFVCTGITMFLLPPVPGVPVYLTGGVMLPSRLQSTYGFWYATFYTTVVCFVIKLVACATQQKLFGEQMSHSVTVRSFVGVNSVSIRAIKLILQQKCLTLPKVAILCGGPDWPTSVLAGILRLPLQQMMMGTIPIYFLIVPTVLAGAFLIKEGDTWGAVSNCTLAGAGLVQGLALVVAGYYVEQVANSRRDEIDAMPIDKEVEAIEERNRVCAEMYRDYTSWCGVLLPDEYKGDRVHVAPVPCLVKCVVIIGALLTVGYSWMLQFFPCFEAFEINMSIYDPPLNGDPLALVLPAGWMAMQMFGLSLCCLFVFDRWALCRRNAYLPRKKARLLELLTERKGEPAYGSSHADGDLPSSNGGNELDELDELDEVMQTMDLIALKKGVRAAQTKNDVLRGMVARLGEVHNIRNVNGSAVTRNDKSDSAVRALTKAEKEIEERIWQAGIEQGNEAGVHVAELDELSEEEEEEEGRNTGHGSGVQAAGFSSYICDAESRG